MLQQSLAVFLVLALLATTLLLLRRKGLAQFLPRLPKTGAGGREMTVIERLALGPHHALHLVQIRGELLLIGVSPSGCEQVARFPGAANRAEGLAAC